jgi:hypothetical protein
MQFNEMAKFGVCLRCYAVLAFDVGGLAVELSLAREATGCMWCGAGQLLAGVTQDHGGSEAAYGSYVRASNSPKNVWRLW